MLLAISLKVIAEYGMNHNIYESRLRLIRSAVDYLELCYPQHRLPGSPTLQKCLEHYQNYVDEIDKQFINGILGLYEKVYQYEAENYEKLR